MSLGRKPSLFWSSFRIDSFFREPKVGSENLSNSHPISQLNMHNHGKQHVKRSVCQWLFRKTSLYDNLCWKFICKSRNLDFNVNECFIIQENPLCNHFRVFILSHGLKWRGWHHVTYISPSLTPPPPFSPTPSGISSRSFWDRHRSVRFWRPQISSGM